MGIGGIKAPEGFSFIEQDFGYGAHLFFVLSAFSLMHSTQHTVKRLGWVGEYFIKRFFRIAPLFYVMIILELVRQAVLSSVAVNIPTIMLNVLFVFGFVPKSGIVWAGWTVGVEMIFYVVFPVLLLVIRTPKEAFIFLLAALLIGYASRYVLHEQYLSVVPLDRLDWSKKTLVSNIYFFAMGIYAFKLKETLDKRNLKFQALIATVAIGVIATFLLTDLTDPFQCGGRLDLMFLAFGFGALCIWQSVSPSWIIANGMFESIGERSFSIYLLHPVIIYYSKSYLIGIYETIQPYLGTSTFFVCAALTIAIVFMFAEFTYRLIELPGIDLGRRLITQRRKG
jgi:peptidoglycan/LPS O-acetylase OafA/YrhL